MLNVEIDDISVQQLELARIAIAVAFRKLQPDDALGRHLHRVVVDLYDYMQSITHRVTERLAGSEVPFLNLATGDIYGGVGTNLSYASDEAARPGVKTRGMDPYGGHDFIGRTAAEKAPTALEQFAEGLFREIHDAWDLPSGGAFGTGQTGAGLLDLLGSYQ